LRWRIWRVSNLARKHLRARMSGSNDATIKIRRWWCHKCLRAQMNDNDAVRWQECRKHLRARMSDNECHYKDKMAMMPQAPVSATMISWQWWRILRQVGLILLCKQHDPTWVWEWQGSHYKESRQPACCNEVGDDAAMRWQCCRNERPGVPHYKSAIMLHWSWQSCRNKKSSWCRNKSAWRRNKWVMASIPLRIPSGVARYHYTHKLAMMPQ
jgi:hypothetical protein